MAKPTRSLASVIGRPATTDSKVKPAMLSVEDTRTEVVSVNIYVTPGDRKRLRQLAIDADTSVQKLAREGLDMMLASRGLSPLEPATANVPSGRRRVG